MDNIEAIVNHVQKFVELNEEEQQEFTAAFKKIKLKKREFVIQPNFIAKHRYYVLNGALRAYVVNDEGQEHTIQLAIEDWWISDYNSYMFQQPASMFVVAVDNSELAQVSFEDEKRLKLSNHKFETFFRMIAERSVAFMQRRIIAGLTQTAEERYDAFMLRYPSLAERIPQYAIASYLGMTTEFLSKIRNKKLKKKT